MSNFEVKIRTIDAIEPIENADSLEIARIVGYQCVVPKNTFSVGQPVVYIPEQAILPNWLIEKMNLVGRLAGGECNRVKIVKLRGVYSQGLVLPIEVSGSNDDWTAGIMKPASAGAYVDDSEWIEFGGTDEYGGNFISVNDLIGMDVAEHLDIVKWEPEIPAGMAGEFFYVGVGKVAPKFDVENYKNFPNIFVDGEEVEFTEKIHGCKIYDTIVDTLENGQMKIGYIVENKLKYHVKSFNHYMGITEYKPIKEWFNHGLSDDWYELETENGTTITITGEDSVWLPEKNCYRKVRDLDVNDIFLIDT